MAAKRPVRLEWQGSLRDSVPEGAEQIPIRGQSHNIKKSTAGSAPTDLPTKITGSVSLRRETKHRSGHPVILLHTFSDSKANSLTLKPLKTFLCTHLACGGSVDGTTIVVQSENKERVVAVLKQYGFLEIKWTGG